MDGAIQVDAYGSRGVHAHAQRGQLLLDEPYRGRHAAGATRTGHLAADDALVEEPPPIATIVRIERARRERASKAMPFRTERRSPFTHGHDRLAHEAERRRFERSDTVQDGALGGRRRAPQPKEEGLRDDDQANDVVPVDLAAAPELGHEPPSEPRPAEPASQLGKRREHALRRWHVMTQHVAGMLAIRLEALVDIGRSLPW